MKGNRLFTILVVLTISMFLLTSGIAIAFTGDGEQGNSNPDLMDEDDRDIRQDDDDDDDEDDEDDEDEENDDSEKDDEDDQEDEEDEDDTPDWDQLIGHEEALDKSFEIVDGTLFSFELEDENDSYIYKIEIVGNESEHEIMIDAYTNEVLEHEEKESDDDLELDLDQLLGHEEAIDIAFRRVDGTLVEFELEDEDDNPLYELEIVENETENKLKIDAYTGEVLSSEVDDPEDTRRGRGVGRFWDGTEGKFISFDLLENGISNYTLKTNDTNLLLFESVIAQNMVIQETESDGPVYEIDGDDTEFKIYDVAPALMKIDAETENDDDHLRPNWDQLIGHEEALDTSYDLANGTLTDFKLEEEDEGYLYEIEIVGNESEHEIVIDAYTGEVLEHEEEEEEDTPDWDQLIGHEEALDTSYDLANGTLTEFELEEQEDGYLYEIEIAQEGVVYQMEIDAYTGELLKFETEDKGYAPREVSFDLGDLEVVGQEGNNLVLAHENYTAKLLSVSKGDGSRNESLDIDVSDGVVNYTFEEDLFFVFRMTGHESEEIKTEREREMEQDISRGISEGRVGGEVIVDRDEEGFSETSVSYADMQMMTEVQENDRVRVTVSSDTLGEEGKIVAIKIYREALNVNSLEELEITFDGDEIDMAEDYDDLVSSSDEAKYLVSMGSERIEVLVSVPHFSIHTIDIAREQTGVGSLLQAQYYLPVVLITAMVILSTVWIVKKKD